MTRPAPLGVFVFALLADVACALMPRSAEASLDVSVSLANLVRGSTAIAVVTPLEQRSEWEGSRIVTLSRVRIETLIAGSASSSEPVVRTLGGSVGDLAQWVEGEPTIVPGEPCLLFLQPSSSGTFRVSARAQGQFGVRRDESGRPFLTGSAGLGTLLEDPTANQRLVPSAVSELRGIFLEAAFAPLQRAWERTHVR
jgi:hypothetical protein